MDRDVLDRDRRLVEPLEQRPQSRDASVGDAKRERVGILLGIAYGAVLGVYGMVTGWPDPFAGITAGVSVVLSITIASILGSNLPLILHRFNVDPAVANPIVTATIDITGILVYFNIARFFLGL